MSELPGPVAEAITRRPVRGSTRVADCDIAWLSWGEPGRQPLVLVHGGAAHAWWWSFTAPLLADTHHVVALDLSGHGDSGRREKYRFALWAAEALAVAHSLPSEAKPILVGHSMGGMVTMFAAQQPDADLAAAIAVDAPLRTSTGRSRRTYGRSRWYRTREEAVARFRPLPQQPTAEPSLVRHVAEHSVTAAPEGWTFKFDPRVFADGQPDRPADLGADMARVRCPFGVVVAERGVVPAPDRERLAEFARGGPNRPPSSYIEIPGGYHHLMFDRPLELVDAVRRLVAAVVLGAAGAG